MAILVTGGAGYIGSHMVLDLLDAGEDVVVLDDLSTGFQWAVPEQAPLIVGDVGDQQLVSSLIRQHDVSEIFHFAASAIVFESVRDPLTYYLNNTANSRNLIEVAVDAGISRLIFSSTCAVYGNPPSLPVTEETPTAPTSPYGASKMMTEMIIRDVARAYPLNYVILRYFNVAGADPKMRSGQSSKVSTHLIKTAVQAALGLRPSLEVYGTDYQTADGTCIRDYIHVTDLVNAHRGAMNYLRVGGQSTTVNCGYGRGFSVLEVVDAVKRVAKTKLEIIVAPRREGDPAQIVASVARAKELLRWEPKFDELDAIVSHALSWEQHLIAKH